MTSEKASAKAAPSGVLVVDDDAGQRQLLAGFLGQQGYAVVTADSAAAALSRLAAGPVALMISDVRMPGQSGLELMRQARERYPSLPVLMVTAFADIRDAVAAMRDGALNYLEKPIDLEELLDVVRQAVAPAAPAAAAGDGTPALPAGVVAESAAMRDVLREAALVAPFDSRVLVLGESGAGKEVVARLIHDWSPRRDRPLVCVNCAALPDPLLESELFGHEKGAFTGAVSTRLGRFEEAAGGTMLLDEVGEMSLPLQAKLLRVTQDGTFQRLGSNRALHSDVRLIAATHRDLEAEVAAGRFREDLFYRLNVIEVTLPPLRERRADILPLATLFAAKYGGGRHRLSPAVSAHLVGYGWPGNVRELQNAMERAVLMARGGLILPEHLPHRVLGGGAAATAAMPAADPEAAGRLQQVEAMLILQTLRQQAFNRTATAKALGISRRALIYKLRRLEEAGHAIHP
ncbi:MAG: sigma-54-dependent Fis family transcriptional regulator [Lentisphaerae bacterium]|nr:sigma-54-dependent Fis family transcriptional regulator [Lentisphaerota bacterium]